LSQHDPPSRPPPRSTPGLPFQISNGWFEGWLANAGVFALRRRVGRGQLLATTFRFADAYGLDPVATLLLNRLVEILREH